MGENNMKTLYELKLYRDVEEAETYFAKKEVKKTGVSYHLQNLEASLEAFKKSKTFGELEEFQVHSSKYGFEPKRKTLVNVYFKATNFIVRLKILQENMLQEKKKLTD